ncbi:MAG: nucleotidyltransferase domain-containing protein [Elusimicrobia bacterium]|nr:nucleotidyltransferase domain-containing protein [Elusimicrobiota bacterium]
MNAKINLDGLTKRIVRKYVPEKVIIFGSQVKGNLDKYSDLDLIIVKKTDMNFVSRLVDPVLLKILPPDADCFVYTPEEFKRMRKHRNPFIISALKNSKVLYERF